MIVHNHEQGSLEWFMARLGIPTSSRASDLITPTGKKSTSYKRYAYELAAEVISEEPLDQWEGTYDMQRGKELEPMAVKFYEYATGSDTQPVGFITDDNGLYGCSPDRLVGDDGMLEIKNLKHHNHLKHVYEYASEGTIPTDYVPQTRMQMLVAERSWCDLLLHHPDLPSKIIRVERDPEYDEILEAQLKLCTEFRDDIVNTIQE